MASIADPQLAENQPEPAADFGAVNANSQIPLHRAPFIDASNADGLRWAPMLTKFALTNPAGAGRQHF